MVTSGLPRAYTTPTTHMACLGHKAPLCLQGRRHSLVCILKTTTKQRHRKVAALQADSLSSWTSGEFNSYGIVRQ